MAEAVVELTLPPAVSSAGLARRHVRQALDSWGLAHLADTAALLTSEVVSNSVLHARTVITLTVSRGPGETVTIAVRDRSTHLPQRRSHTPGSTTGRGLHLLDRLALSWEVRPEVDGKSLVFSVGDRGDP